MKRIKLIAVSLMIALMLVGAGYAYWTDSLVIQNTVATGEFKMALAGIPGIGDYDNYIPRNSNESADPFGSGNDYVNPTIAHDGVDITTVGDNKIIFENDNLYPGSGAYLRFRFTNKGSVPAILQNIDPNITSGRALKDSFIYTIGSVYLEQTDVVRRNSISTTTTTLYADTTRYYTFDAFISALTNKLKYYTPDDSQTQEQIILQPGESIVVAGERIHTGDKIQSGYDIFFDPNTTEVVNGVNTENATFSFELNFNYTQWNKQ